MKDSSQEKTVVTENLRNKLISAQTQIEALDGQISRDREKLLKLREDKKILLEKVSLLINSKLNSNPYPYKLKFPSTSKQMYNSKFQEFEIVRILKIQKKRPNLDQKTLPKINKHEENQQKRRNEKRRQPSKTPSFIFFLSSSFVFISHHLHKNKKNKNYKLLA